MIRHRATGEFMPELKRTRGYSHWNPAKEPTELRFNKDKLIGTPRLFRSIRHANAAIAAWNSLPNGKMRGGQTYDGWEEDLTLKEDGRKKEDLQIVIVDINETGVVS